MLLLLQITLSLAITILTIFLVLALIQARRTAAAIEHLANSAITDLHKMADDIHEVRNRVEVVGNLVQRYGENPSISSQVIAGIIQAMPSLFGRQTPTSTWIDTLLTVIQSATRLLRRAKAEPFKEEAHER